VAEAGSVTTGVVEKAKRKMMATIRRRRIPIAARISKIRIAGTGPYWTALLELVQVGR
jgi:hypothetical protein